MKDKEHTFLIARDNDLNIKLGDYRSKITTLTGVIEVKEQLLQVIDKILPKDADRIVNRLVTRRGFL